MTENREILWKITGKCRKVAENNGNCGEMWISCGYQFPSLPAPTSRKLSPNSFSCTTAFCWGVVTSDELNHRWIFKPVKRLLLKKQPPKPIVVATRFCLYCAGFKGIIKKYCHMFHCFFIALKKKVSLRNLSSLGPGVIGGCVGKYVSPSLVGMGGRRCTERPPGAVASKLNHTTRASSPITVRAGG